jgi:WD40 repeat protein
MLIFKAHAKPITAVAFSPDMTMLATGSGTERLFRVWRLVAPGGGLLEKPEKVHEWPNEWVANVAFTTDSKIVVASGSQKLAAYDLAAKGKLVLDEAKASGFKMCVSSKNVIYAHGMVATKRWSLPDGKPIKGEWKGDSDADKNHGAGPVAVTSDGGRIAAYWSPDEGPPDARFVVRDIEGKIVARYDREKVSVQPARARFGKKDTLFATAFGPDIVVWDAKKGTEIKTLSVGKKHVPDVAFTAGGKRLIAVSNDETVRQWDTETWKELEVYTWKAGKLTALDVSSDGCRVAAGGQAGKVVIWDVVH